MKIRRGFVSNSSSSSFVVKLKHLSEYQQERIMHNTDAMDEGWYFTRSIAEGILYGSTIMDNYDLYHFMKEEIGVNMKKVTWDD